jgi:hypothetical protein
MLFPMYLFHILSRFRTYFKEEIGFDIFAIGFPLLFWDLPHVLEIELCPDKEENSFLMHVVLHLSHPHS